MVAGCALFGVWVLLLPALPAGAWDYEAHHVINELALAALPPSYGGFELTPALKNRIAFLGGEPDRWRNVTDPELENYNKPDHFIDLENLPLYGLTAETLPPLRYDFMAVLARERAAHPENFPALDPTKDADHTQELEGFLPWAITEYYEKLKSGFSTLKALRQNGGTPEEVANAEADLVYMMGVMGHYVGDGSQPLHTTRHFNGWGAGPNPQGYTTSLKFHSWIDGGYFKKTGGVTAGPLLGKIHPAQRLPGVAETGGAFKLVVAYLVDGNKYVEPLYQFEKAGRLTGDGDQAMAGRPLLEEQLLKGGQMLGNLWYTAWLEAPEDTYLERQLHQRAAGGTAPP
jgi:hypothetical protein